MDYELVIVGGGMTGLALAALLADSGLRIAVLENRPSPQSFRAGEPFAARVSARSPASCRLLQQAGAWEGILARRACAYESMVVWDGTGAGEVRFDAAEMGEPALGYIVENRIVQLALLDVLAQKTAVELLFSAPMQGFVIRNGQVCVELEGNRVLGCQLLVGADGADSQARSRAGLDWKQDDPGQKGLVGTVVTTEPHRQTAWQRFMPDGPLAFLPLPDAHACSMVWTLPSDVADACLGRSRASLCDLIAAGLDQRLGAVVSVDALGAFPLQSAYAPSCVAERLALIGDAAHVVHPLAGQGVNLGFRDVAVLADAVRHAPDPGASGVLRRYARSRKGDNLLTLQAMDGFRLLFGNRSPLLTPLRNSGMQWVERLPWLKQRLARQAMGV